VGRRCGGSVPAWRPHFGVAIPPSTGITAPVTYAPARDDRESAMPAMSSGSPIRPSGQLFLIASPKLRSVSAIILLSNGPGAIAFTVTFGASLRASTRVRWCTAALLDEYA